jgi:hypothetical protein
MFKKIFTGALLMLATLSVLGGAPVEGLWKPKAKKLIDMSWSNPSVDYLKDNIERMEQEAPIDGVSIRMEGKQTIDGETKSIWIHTIWSQVPWAYEDFTGQIDTLKAIKFKKFTDNFLFTATYEADVDWFSDPCWDIITNHFDIASRIAKETGLKGLVLDIEEYHKPFWCNYKGHSHRDAVRIARQRGQQVGNAIFKNYPDIKLLCMFLFSFGTYLKGDAWAQILSHSFYNGIYDVMPPEAIIIEGHEYFGYAAKSMKDFERLRQDLDRTFMTRVAEKNIRKYRCQTQLAPPLYPDSYFNMENPVTRLFLHPEIDELPKLEFVRRQLTWALSVADEYVWIYSEAGSWWSKSSHPRATKTWEEICPGINNVINSVHNPNDYTPDGAVNLLQIPSLDEEPGNWLHWTAAKGDGQGGWKDGIIWLEGSEKSACVHQSVDVTPGKGYLLRVKARPRTPLSGTMHLHVAFRDKDNEWMAEKQSVPCDIDTNGQWHTLSIFIEAPENAGKLSFQLGTNHLKPGECAEFKEPELFEM